MHTRRERNGEPPAGGAPGLEEAADLPSTLRLADYLEALWRRKGLLLWTSLLAALAAAFLTAGMPNVYRSQARLMVSAPREAVDASRVLGLTRGQAPFSPAESAMAVLQSRDLMERVVARLGPEAILGPLSPSAEADAQVKGLKGLLLPLLRLFQRGAAGCGTESEPDPVKALAALRKSLTIYGDQNSPAIQVLCRAGSADRAQAILQAFVEEGLRFYIELRSSESDRLFVEEQRARCVEEARAAQAAYRAFLAEHRITDFRGELAGRMELYAELDRAIGRDRLELGALGPRVRQLQEKLRAYEPFLTQPTLEVALPNPALARLEEQILQREVELQELKTRSTEAGTPQIRDKEQQIAFLRERLKAERAQPVEDGGRALWEIDGPQSIEFRHPLAVTRVRLSRSLVVSPSRGFEHDGGVDFRDASVAERGGPVALAVGAAGCRIREIAAGRGAGMTWAMLARISAASEDIRSAFFRGW